jgi:DNA replicative helicase MCM subunit Mcm2 (Cdc46/Mcm family)
MSKLVKIAGIAIAASRVKAKATHVTLLCKNCRSVRTVPCRPGLGGAIVPRSCDHVPQVCFSVITPLLSSLQYCTVVNDDVSKNVYISDCLIP